MAVDQVATEEETAVFDKAAADVLDRLGLEYVFDRFQEDG